MGNFLGLSKIYMGLNFVDAVGPRDPIEIKPKSNTACSHFLSGLHLKCKYLQSLLTITILLAEGKKEIMSKLEITDRKDRKLERFQTAFSALPSKVGKKEVNTHIGQASG